MARVISGHTVTVDPQDAHLLDEYTWLISRHGYVCANTGKGTERHTVLLHRLISNPPAGQEVDHANQNRQDCTRANLRNCTRSQNHANRSKFRNCSSQYKGVSLIKASGKWGAFIKENGRLRNLGTFTDELDAARAYNSNAARLYGPFARLNTLPEGA